ncbi:hypothetical protein INS49_000744 [Diaporthe citri]|uniref:uncharacterized protein n=1 Tax=Diaporthe citri TaxID=83186 RepID=UPI001C7FF7F2|nr:uncharacterized protein INS49_000744 [Diaporthe citri]KAG6366566.1 hypothetical protein INS49_000744 [Diaporthe citri]
MWPSSSSSVVSSSSSVSVSDWPSYSQSPSESKCTSGERQIEKFRFWRDRLGVLKQAFDETTPGSMSQWWHDRRNGPRWFTFWVAGVALIFALPALFPTMVQAVEGALQVYLAYHPK